MTFEEPLLEQAQKELETCEKLCTDSNKMFSSFKKVFGMSSSSSSNSLKDQSSSKLSRPENSSKEQILEDKFTKAIILADCKLFLAILTFIRQEVSGYLSNGILQIRRSWKIYAKAQRQLYDIYKKLEPNAEQIYGSDPNSNLLQLWIEDNDDTENDKLDKQSSKLGEFVEDECGAGMSLDTVKRLLGAVSFGYGLFQICLSFMPPNVLKLIKVLGFEGERSIALKAINFTSNSKDMRAPFADMMILWYSTIATPLFNVTEADVNIADEDTKLVLEKNLQKYSKSSLFHYFHGKYFRTTLRDLDKSLGSFEVAYENSKHIREIQFISVYEIGWIYLMNLNYAKSLEYFDVLARESRWSRSFNAYICAVVAGSTGDCAKANVYVKDALKLIAAQTRKPNPIEAFALKRLEYFKKKPIDSKDFCELLCIEMLYMWICVPYCHETHLKQMLDVLDRINQKNFVALKCLFEGAIHMELKNPEMSEQCYKESIARGESEKHPPFGKYVLPYAHFQLANYYIKEKKLDLAKSHLNKAKDNYSSYELENRLQTQIRSLQRLIKFYTDGPKMAAAMRARAEADEEQKKQKQAQEKNFYL